MNVQVVCLVFYEKDYLFIYLLITYFSILSSQNILFDVLSGVETEETPIVNPPSEQETEHKDPETADESAVGTGKTVCENKLMCLAYGKNTLILML